MNSDLELYNTALALGFHHFADTEYPNYQLTNTHFYHKKGLVLRIEVMNEHIQFTLTFPLGFDITGCTSQDLIDAFPGPNVLESL